MNLEKVIFGFFILLAATLNFGFFIGDIGNPELHSVYELAAALVVSLIATALKARAGCKSSIPEILNLETLTSDMVGITDARDRTAIIDRLCELGFLRQVTGRDDPMHPYRTFTWIGP